MKIISISFIFLKNILKQRIIQNYYHKQPQTICKIKIINGYNKLFRKLLLLLIVITFHISSFTQSGTVKTTAMPPPLSPYIKQYLQSGSVTSTFILQNIRKSGVNAFIYGKIQCLAPKPFTIMLDTNYRQGTNRKTLFNGMNFPLTTQDLLNAFDNFFPTNLIVSPGAPPLNINGDIKLPDGTYNICFFAKYFDTLEAFSDLTSPMLGCSNNFIIACAPINGALINTIVTPPVNPIIEQTVSAGGVKSTIQFNIAPGCGSSYVKLFGKIERLSPLLTITPNSDYIPQTIPLTAGSVHQISISEQRDALANFDEAKLVANGINLASITDANGKIKLPDGTYNICYYARYFDSASGVFGNNASNPNLGCGTFTINCAPVNGVQITTIVKPQTNPVISQAISSGSINASLQINNQPLCNTQVKLFGRIECISPSPFSIALNPNYQQQDAITLTPGAPVQLSINQQLNAFSNFQENNLVTDGIQLSSIKDANNNIKLPDGNYRICFYARYVNLDGTLGGNASVPDLGCGTFTLCNQAGGAPQFTQPVSSNIDINSDISVVQPASPVVFTWIPPQSTCGLPPGGFTYDFEIRELLPNQNVNDAVNNPFVFRKTGLPSTTFILDTNLNKNILHTGARYAIRVRAVNVNPNSTAQIDNNGYSRIEAFQYGGSVIPPNVPSQLRDYYIPFTERKTGFWNDVYASYKNHTHADTLVPIDEYIAFALTQNGTAYNIDAIDLFLSLNPELANLKKVKLSYIPQLPVFPEVSANDKQIFAQEHTANLEADNAENNKFNNYLDTLNIYRHNITDTASKIVNDLYEYLNDIKPQITTVDRVTVNIINEVLSELMYELRLYSANINNSQYRQLQNLSDALHDLTAESVNSTSFLYMFPLKKESSLSSYKSTTGKHVIKICAENNVLKFNDDSIAHLSAIIMNQLLPFDVVVWRSNTVAPYKPVLIAPDLTASYRIFYTVSNLYNHKNPEINAKSTSHLASTVQVSLPSNLVFTFWTLNMRNHKMTQPQDVDLKDILSSMNKVSSQFKKSTIVLKVN